MVDKEDDRVMEPMTFEAWKKQYADVLKRRREECQECGGYGEVKCEYCGGSGVYGHLSCPECDGDAVCSCVKCDPRRLYDAELEKDKKVLAAPKEGKD